MEKQTARMQVLWSAVRTMDTSFHALLSELQHIWDEIGETVADKDRMLLELEKECLEVYRRKVDEASRTRARLHHSLAAKEAELATLVATIGDLTLHSQQDKRPASLKEQIAFVKPQLEDLRIEKEERLKQFSDIKSQIGKINGEISGCTQVNNVSLEEHNLSLRKLNEYQAHLRTLQKEKSDRLHKVLEYVNEVHCLCGVLGFDFGKTVSEVHPSLGETGPGQSKNISNDTLQGLARTILKLKTEKKARIQKLKDIVNSLFELWNLMDTPEEERKQFGKITGILSLSEDQVIDAGVLSIEIIEQTEAEVEKLSQLKASRMRELVMKKRAELEEIWRRAHIEPDMSTSSEKSNALIDSGIVDPSELLANIEAQIVSAKNEAIRRKEIMERIEKWVAACEEESWLEDYNRDENRYTAGKGAHINLKRAERARVIVNKIPGIVDILMSKIHAWEEERNTAFLYDGVKLVFLLEEYINNRQKKEEEKKRFRDQKKLQDTLLKETEAIYGSKPSPKRSSSFKKGNGLCTNGSLTPTSRRLSLGSGASEILTPRSQSGHQNGYFRETRRLSTAPLNFVALTKEDTVSFASIYGSEQGSPTQ